MLQWVSNPTIPSRETPGSLDFYVSQNSMSSRYGGEMIVENVTDAEIQLEYRRISQTKF